MDCITKYAILTRRTELQEYSSPQIPLDKNNAHYVDKLKRDAGTLLKIYKSNSGSNMFKFGSSIVQILDFEDDNLIFYNLYECPRNHILKVSENLWPYVISIRNPKHRLNFIQNQSLCRWIVYLKLKDLVSVSGMLFGYDALRYDCIIRYIGPVQELFPVGYFFGLELLHLDSGPSPQSEEISFSIKYMECDPSLSLFVTADKLSPLPNDIKKKFSALDLLNGTLERVRTAISPNSCLSESISTAHIGSQYKNKRNKKKEPTAKFYGTHPPKEKNALTNNFLLLNASSTDEDASKNPANLLNMSDGKSFSLNQLMNEEFKQSVENYEKNLERQHATTKSPDIQTTKAGILKNRQTIHGSEKKITSKNDDGYMKPLTIMSLEDRDIIVIDKADIRESTKSKSSIIVVDKQHQEEVDLADLLGSNWPHVAGDAASILNQATTQTTLEQQFTAKSETGSKNKNVTTQSMDTSKSTGFLSSSVVDASNDNYNIAANFAACGNTTDDITFNENIKDDERAMCIQSSPISEIPNTSLGVGSMIEATLSDSYDDIYGVIRWIGIPPGTNDIMVGVELDDEHNDKQLLTTNGSFNGIRLFKCPQGRGLFVTPDHCARDKRFIDIDGTISNNTNTNSRIDSKMFGQVECPPIPGAIAPLKILNLEELENICGKFKGIQGHHNSCYLDATLFSMFTFTSVFDSLLFRAPDSEDISHYNDVQNVLREEIVNPLRKKMFVRADRVMKLRKLLDKLSSVSGLTSEEKDPEEFLNSLLAQIMRVEPFLKLSSGQDAFFYQLFVEKDERLSFPSVQQLFEQSFHSSDIKLKEVPSCLIIQMPRFGKNYKMYPRILPSQVLDVTDIIEDSPRQCSVCGKLGEFECHDCFGILQSGVGLESTAFCRKCLDTVHMHAKRANHTSKKLSVPQDFRIMAEHMTVPRLYMELFAVVCIETSHYVAFVKAGSGPDAPWCFFDSMADRNGEQNGYNIPEMRPVPDLPLWLSEEGARTVNETSTNDKMLPEHAKRLFCDAYMCMYQSTDVMMYR